MKIIKLVILSIFILLVTPAFAKQWGPQVGEKAPEIIVNDITGKPFNLEQSVKKGPVVILFYRGGWCPFCNRQLKEYQDKVWPTVKQAGGQLVAISIDKVGEGIKSAEKQSLGFTIVSDNDVVITKKYGLQFQVEDSLVTMYKNKYKIDLEAASDRKHHMLPVPAVYVVNGKGVITYARADENYKVRAPVGEVVAAVKAISSKK